MMGDITNEIENISKKEVYKYYERALAIDSMNIAVLNNYSYLLSEDSTQLNKALQLAERMMTREISNPIYLDTYAWVLFKSGQVEKALNIMRRAISLDTTNSHVLLMHYGDVLFESNQKYLARIYWRKALEAGANIKDIEPRIKKLD
jgi:Tfp pilus assembly protein PilF